MTQIASHITSFLQQRLPVERRASDNTCESYAYAFKLLFEYAGTYILRFHRRNCILNSSMHR
jgi:hypothetical protein